MSRCDNRRAQQGMIALDLAVATLARLAMRAGDLLAAEILGPVEGDERSVAEPAERLAHRGLKEQLLRALKAGRESSAGSAPSSMSLRRLEGIFSIPNRVWQFDRPWPFSSFR